MGYDRDQASEEFARWSESYDHSILQWLLFGPSHRVLIRRIQAVAGVSDTQLQNRRGEWGQCLIHRTSPRAHANGQHPAPLAHCLDCVGTKVEDHLVQQGRIARNPTCAVVDFTTQLDVGRYQCLEQIQSLRGHDGNIDGLR